MFTKWQQVEDWVRDNGLTWWRFTLDEVGAQVTADGQQEQKRSNKVITLSDALPGDIDEKLALTRKRLLTETSHTLYGQGKRGKENTGLMYCEVRLVDEFQQPSTQAVSSVPAYQPVDEEKMIARIRKEVQQEMELQRYQDERKAFERERKEFEAEKESAIGLLVRHLTPVLAAMGGQKRVAGVDANAPVHAAPIRAIDSEQEAIDEQDMLNDVFTDKESDQLFELMARFKAVEPRYLELLENVVIMAENGDQTYNMAKGFLLK